MILGCRDAHRTGQSRFRSVRQWGRERLIFQVEWAGHVTRLLGPHPDTEWQTWWRDATTEDISHSKWSEPKTPQVAGDRSRDELNS